MKNNTSKNRFELEIDNKIVFANYRKNAEVLTIDYVESPVELRGTGAASKLMQEIAELAKNENLKIVPICGYAAVWLRKHKEFHDLLA